MVYEDFLSAGWTEVGAITGLVVTNYKIDYECWRDETAFYYKDYGAGHFGDFEHLITTRVTPVQASRYFFIWLLSNDLLDARALFDNNKDTIMVRWLTTSHFVEVMYLSEFENGNSFSDTSALVDASQTYYLTIKKTGTAFSCDIYTDANRTLLLDTMNLTLHSDYSFRYLYVASSYNTGNFFGWTGWNQNLDIQEAVAVPLGLTLKPAPKGGTGRPAMLTGGASFGG